MQDNDRLKRLTNIKEDETSLLSKKGEEWDGGQPPSKKEKKKSSASFLCMGQYPKPHIETQLHE